MSFLVQALVVVAAAIFLLLGTAHGVLTLRDLDQPRTFTPRDPALREAMQKSTIAFRRDVNLWKAWMGFNITHSLGLVLFGAALLYVGLLHPTLFAQSVWLQGFCVAVSAAYFVTSLNFFFSTPTIGTAIATACSSSSPPYPTGRNGA
jgi:hypothetical protein